MDGENQNDKTRPCHVCRMPISVLAIKCRFCGAELGRPREKAHQFTIEDLGGETVQTYTLSGNVMSALESFRVEELSAPLDPGAILGGNIQLNQSGVKPGMNTPLGQSGVHNTPVYPNLNASGVNSNPFTQNLTGSGFSQSVAYTPPKPQPQPVKKKTFSQKFGMAGIIVGAVLVLLIGGGITVATVKKLWSSEKAPAEIAADNKAIEMIEHGENVLDALAVALAAKDKDPSEANTRILDRVRQKIAEDVDARLSADPWNMQALTSASDLVYGAVQKDRNGEVLNSLRKEVDEETKAYKMMIEHLETSKSVTLTLVYPDKPNQTMTKSEGDTIRGRFVIKKISSNYVQFKDSLRKTKTGSAREFKVYQDGTIN